MTAAIAMLEHRWAIPMRDAITDARRSGPRGRVDPPRGPCALRSRGGRGTKQTGRTPSPADVEAAKGRGAWRPAPSRPYSCAGIRSQGYYPAHERHTSRPRRRSAGTVDARSGRRHLSLGPVPPRHRRLAHRRLRRPRLVRPLRVAEQADLGRELRHRSRLDVPRHLPAVLAARRAAGEVRQGAEQPRRLHPRQPHRRHQPPEVEGPAGDRRHLPGLAVLRRRARPGGRHRQHRQQDRRPVLRPLPDPRRQAAEARLRQRGVGLQRPAGEPGLRRGARHRSRGDQAAGPLHAAGRPHRRRRRLRHLPAAARDGLRELPAPAAGAELHLWDAFLMVPLALARTRAGPPHRRVHEGLGRRSSAASRTGSSCGRWWPASIFSVVGVLAPVVCSPARRR